VARAGPQLPDPGPAALDLAGARRAELVTERLDLRDSVTWIRWQSSTRRCAGPDAPPDPEQMREIHIRHASRLLS